MKDQSHKCRTNKDHLTCNKILQPISNLPVTIWKDIRNTRNASGPRSRSQKDAICRTRWKNAIRRDKKAETTSSKRRMISGRTEAVEPKDRKSHRQAAESIGATSINRWLIPFGSQKYVELGRPGSLVGPECKAPHLIERTIILRVPLSHPLYLSLSRLSPIRLLQFETEYISRSATSTDARQDKWPRDGGYITFQNWPNRRLSGDEKEGPIYRAAGPYTCIGRRGVAWRGVAQCSAMHCLSRAAATSSLFKDSSSARFPNRTAIFEREFVNERRFLTTRWKTERKREMLSARRIFQCEQKSTKSTFLQISLVLYYLYRHQYYRLGIMSSINRPLWLIVYERTAREQWCSGKLSPIYFSIPTMFRA